MNLNLDAGSECRWCAPPFVLPRFWLSMCMHSLSRFFRILGLFLEPMLASPSRSRASLSASRLAELACDRISDPSTEVRFFSELSMEIGYSFIGSGRDSPGREISSEFSYSDCWMCDSEDDTSPICAVWRRSFFRIPRKVLISLRSSAALASRLSPTSFLELFLGQLLDVLEYVFDH